MTAREDRLESWKEISAYFERTIRTCQRWEANLGLPVHRLDESSRARVYAFKHELDIWLEHALHKSEVREAGVRERRRRRLFAAGIPLAAAAFGLLGWSILRDIRKEKGGADPTTQLSLVIVSLANKSGDEKLAYLSQSLPADLILDIQRSSAALSVVGFASYMDVTRQLGLTPSNILSAEDQGKIAEKTGAKRVLAGSLFKSGNDLRVDYELKDGRTLQNISAGSVIGPSDDLPGIEDHLPERIFATLGLAGPSPYVLPVDCSPGANRAYRVGRDAEERFLVTRLPADIAVAIEMFKKAQTADPGCPLSYLGLGDAYRWDYSFQSRGPDLLALMIRNYTKAYEISPELAETNVGLGWNRYFAGDNAGACEYFIRAAKIKPGDPGINMEIGNFLIGLGHVDRAARRFTEVISKFPGLTKAYWLRSLCYEWLGDYEAALLDGERILKLEPTSGYLRCMQARLMILEGNLAEADAQLSIAETLSGGTGDAEFTRALFWAARGNRDRALSVLSHPSRPTILRSYIESMIHAELRDKDGAFDLIARMIKTGFSELVSYPYGYLILKNPNNHFYDSLRRDARFLEILNGQKRRYEEGEARLGDL